MFLQHARERLANKFKLKNVLNNNPQKLYFDDKSNTTKEL